MLSPHPLTELALGIRCWPQWKRWGFCYQTGDLVDPNGKRYSPQRILALAWAMQLYELRQRVLFADSGEPVHAVALHDYIEHDDTPKGHQARQAAAFAALDKLG